MEIKDSDVVNVLKNDGVKNIDKTKLRKYENISSININDLRKEFGDGSWAVRIAYNNDFGGVLIQQLPGEGNRLHYHEHADENWVILEGKWKWKIEGEGEMVVEKGSIIVVKRNTWHQITCIGDSPGIRYAITVPDVEHIYKK